MASLFKWPILVRIYLEMTFRPIPVCFLIHFFLSVYDLGTVSVIQFSYLYSGGTKDETVINELLEMWHSILPQKMSFFCVREDTGEIAGVNFVRIVSKDDRFGEQALKNVSNRTSS